MVRELLTGATGSEYQAGSSSPALSAQFRAELSESGISPVLQYGQTPTREEWDNIAKSIEGEIQSTTSMSQMSLTSLQSFMNKFTNNFDVASNLESKVAKNKDNLAANLR